MISLPRTSQELKARFAGRRGFRRAPKIRTFFRHKSGPTAYTPEHRRMQAKLMKELKLEFPHGEVVREEEFVDVIVHEHTANPFRDQIGSRTASCNSPWARSDPRIRLSSNSNSQPPVELGDCRAPRDRGQDQDYLKRLQTEFALPLNYRVVNKTKK